MAWGSNWGRERESRERDSCAMRKKKRVFMFKRSMLLLSTNFPSVIIKRNKSFHQYLFTDETSVGKEIMK